MQNSKNKNTYRYFLYSSTQYKDRLEIEKKIGKVFIPGVVIYKGKKKEFTEITTDPSRCMYADKKIVAEGYIEDMKYTQPRHEWGAS